MQCPNCGNETPAGSTVCQVCETPTELDSTTQNGAAPLGAPMVAAGPADDGSLPTGYDADATRTATPEARAPRQTPSSGGLLSVGRSFGPRYRIDQLLGAGGMGAVYKAYDQELDIPVALKVILPQASEDKSKAARLEQRFKRELLLARQVTHKNVVRIHDIGELDGIKYITMSYVDGADLATILHEEGTLAVPRGLRIARQTVAGLVAAHEAGVVHRDLKPANIMISAEDDEALIMDFGVARFTSRTTTLTASGVVEKRRKSTNLSSATFGRTSPGAIVGTAQYMAPEQAKGVRADQRADVYAFGLIFREMFVERKRSADANPIAELMQRAEKAPEPVRDTVEDFPEALDRVIAKCLEPDRDERYSSSAELALDLDKLDDNGEPLPVLRTLSPRLMAGVAVLMVALLAGTWWLVRTPPIPVQPDPLTVLIADFKNTTNDPAFDGTLEPMLKLALEEAPFISAFDRLGIRRMFGVPPPETLDETSARQLAVNQGVGVVLFGSLAPDAGGYELSMSVVEVVTGNVIAAVDDRTSNRDQVLGLATELVAEIREALGDDPSDAARRFAQETLSTTSLEVVGEYAAAMEAYSRGRFDDALQGFSNAVVLDPDFGLAYAGMAAVSRNLGRQEDAENYLNEAISRLDSMTERERYRTRGLFYGVTGDYQACVTEYGDLVARYAGDAASRNNLALCAAFLRDWPTALEEMRQLVEMVPARGLYRSNLATYLSYAGEFQAGEEAARLINEPGMFGLTALAFAQLGQGRLSEANATYQVIGEIDAVGASYRVSGLADVAMYEGRFSDAVRLFREGATADLANEEPDLAGRKLAELAQTHVLRGESGPAIAAAEEALAVSQAMSTRFLAARVFVEAGEMARARTLAEDLASEFQAEAQAYAKIIEGVAALKDGDAREAIALLTEANALLDTWIGHFDLGRAYLDAGGFLQAEGEFDRCLTRRGEALSLFLDEEPTYGHFPPVYYYQGRVREALNNAGSAESYRRYLDIRGNAGEDPLLPEVRQRAGE